ncbi:MAG: hypothetical protein MUC87_15805 [Bacteroidia bacterium]|jgi:hypothetical protein|nr:hypothetical protein [Bacteroidia bacterium]
MLRRVFWPLANRVSFAAVCVLGLLYIGFQANVIRSYPTYISGSNALSWDIYGYYMYLPATVIYNDAGIENSQWKDSLDRKYQTDRPKYQFYNTEKNRQVNVYPVGQSIAMFPFFMAGHAAAILTGAPADGFSPPYQYAAILSGLFYSILGLFLLRRILLRWFGDRMAALLLLLVSIGTNQFYYACFDTTMPHNYLFAGNVLLLLLTIKWHENPSVKLALFIGAVIGWVTITRPSELVLVLIPLFWGIGNWQDLKDKIKLIWQRKTDVMVLGIAVVAVGFIQLAYWKYTSGKWTTYHHSEGFDFLHPFTLKFLFSFKKGWFVYTPLMAIATLGFVALWKAHRKLFLPLFSFFIINLWVVSSWECWWYATSWSQRPMVQSVGIMAIPLGFLLVAVAKRVVWKSIFYAATGFTFLLSIFQMWQSRAYIISGDRMTADYYLAIFGRTAVPPGAEELLEIDRWNAAPLDEVLHKYNKTTLLDEGFEQPVKFDSKFICDTLGSGGSKKSMLLNSENKYAIHILRRYRQLTARDHVRVRISADVFGLEKSAAVLLNFDNLMLGRQHYGYSGQNFDSTAVKYGQWNRIHADYITPVILHSRDTLSAGIWNNGGTSMLIDNIKVEVYEPK